MLSFVATAMLKAVLSPKNYQYTIKMGKISLTNFMARTNIAG
jgi:hypothetical protein